MFVVVEVIGVVLEKSPKGPEMTKASLFLGISNLSPLPPCWKNLKGSLGRLLEFLELRACQRSQTPLLPWEEGFWSLVSMAQKLT